MRLLLKQRFFSWTDTYDIYGEDGGSKYFVKAEFFTLGHVIHVYDMRESEVGCIRQRLLTFLPKFDIEIGGRYVGTIKKEFTFFKPLYSIDFNGWNVKGNFLAWDYEITDAEGRTVVNISKEIFNFTDTYSIEFYRQEDEIPALLTVIAIDAANCSQNNK